MPSQTPPAASLQGHIRVEVLPCEQSPRIIAALNAALPAGSRVSALSANLPLGDGADVQLLPAGRFSARDGRPGPGQSWTLTDEQGQRLTAELTAQAATGTEFLFDIDHQTLRAADNGQPAPAAGWASQFVWRPGMGLFATDVRWTGDLQSRITARQFRYVSPVITWAADGTVTGVLMAAITNYPALLGMQPLGAALQALFDQHNTTHSESPMNELLKKLLARLGIAATDDAALAAPATETAALAAVDALLAQRQSAALSAAVVAELGLPAGADQTAALTALRTLRGSPDSAGQAIAALQAEVARLSAQAVGDQVDRVVTQAITDRKLLPAMEAWARDLGKKDMAALTAFIAQSPVLLPGAGGQTGGADPTGGAGGTAALTAETRQVIQNMGISEADWLKKHGKAA